MYIQFDKNKMHVQVLVGILEKYEPSKNIKDIYTKVQQLNEKMEEFNNSILKPEMEKIELLIQEENEKQVKKHSKKNK
jgi:uncharacterized protein YaaR (DUF327 family)